MNNDDKSYFKVRQISKKFGYASINIHIPEQYVFLVLNLKSDPPSPRLSKMCWDRGLGHYQPGWWQPPTPVTVKPISPCEEQGPMHLSHLDSLPLVTLPHGHSPCGAGRSNTLRRGTKRWHPPCQSALGHRTSPQHKGQRHRPPPPRPWGVTEPSSGNRRRKERPFKGSGEEKALGEARARALFPLALIVRGVLGQEGRIVSQGLYQAGAEGDKRKENS